MHNITFTPGEVSRYYENRVPRLKQTGAEWRCGCPIHGGKDPNFTVDPTTGRYFCHSACGCGGDILSLEMSLTGADFKTAKAEVFRIVSRIEPRQTTAGWREIERYPYTDRDGNLLFESVRYLKPDGKKTFVQVRPSGVEAAGTTDPERIGCVRAGGIVVGLSKGKYLLDPKAERATGKPTWKRVDDQIDYGGAEYHFSDCPRVPYRLPKVLKAEMVYLPEGEKDVHTFESWELVASCNPGGSGESHLYTGWAEYFRNRHVIILPDNDDPGRKHALATASALLSVAASIRVVELPVPPKGDVTDWRNAGGTLDQFLELVDAAEPLDATSLSALRSRWSTTYQEPKRQAARVEAADEWPKLEPLQSELPPVELFSEDLLPASFRPLVQDVAERMQVPTDFPAAVSVLCLAGVVSRRAMIQPKAYDASWRVIPNLWGAIVAPPGFLKTPVIRVLTRPLVNVQDLWRAEFEAEKEQRELEKEEADLRYSAWKEEYKRACKKKSEELPIRPDNTIPALVSKRFLLNDATFEKIHEIMAENPAGVFVIRDELTGWWSMLDKPGREGERAFCLEAWNGDGSFTVDRIGRGTVHVPHCCMSMMGGIQPARLRSYLVDALTDGPGNDGLIQRFQVLVWPDTPSDWKYVDRRPDAEAELRVERVFRRLLAISPEMPMPFRFTSEAQEVFTQWLGELEAKVRGDSLHPAVVSHLSKYRSLMPALALLFELADWASGSEPFEGMPEVSGIKFVNLDHARQAAAFCEYLESHARRVYSCFTTPEMRAARELAVKIKEQKVGLGGFSCRAIYLKGWSGLDSPEVVRVAIDVLKDAGWVREVQVESGPAGGRPSTRYEVNRRCGNEVLCLPASRQKAVAGLEAEGTNPGRCDRGWAYKTIRTMFCRF
jgi:putative DNA primase/helicase